MKDRFEFDGFVYSVEATANPFYQLSIELITSDKPEGDKSLLLDTSEPLHITIEKKSKSDDPNLITLQETKWESLDEKKGGSDE